uniref:Ig-like domain-containing protein n=1 Tax=Pygocentrus nattereri TaxID=42514 RepID=A0A3B4E602_PYGNA
MFHVLWGMYMSLFLVLLFAVGCNGLHVQGPSGPLVAQLGDTVLLPCFSQIHLPLEGLQVEWRKADSESLVILFQQGEIRPDLQSQSFRDRVHLFPDEISKGNFSILLNNVVRNDTGVYRCKVSTTQESSETEVELKDIEDLVKGADHAIFASVGEEVILNCSVDSNLPAHMIEEVSWKKRSQDQDDLILFFQDNEVFLSHESYQERAELFIPEIPKGNFSLKVKNVKLEDKGEFICEVHTSDWSAHTTVVLQKLGFSTSQILILVLCFIALQLSVGLCVPVFILLKNKATSGKVMHASLILCPNICIFVAFILWSTDGSLIEIVTCSTVSILRPLMLMKTFPHLDRFPSLHIVLSSTILTIFNLAELSVYILIGISTNNFTTAWYLPLEAVIHAVAWLSMIFLLRCNRCQKQRCHFVKRGIGYVCCTVITAALIITFGVLCVYYVNLHMENDKDRAGYMALTAFLHVLSTISLFKHPKHLPDLPHILIYMFGAVGLNIVNSITLITELSLKADKGAPTLQDLRVIVVPFETIFVSAWLALQIYHFWMGTRHRIKQNFEDQREAGAQDPQAMVALSPSVPKPSDPSEDDPSP